MRKVIAQRLVVDEVLPIRAIGETVHELTEEVTGEERTRRLEAAAHSGAIRIVLADDHQVVRRGLQLLLNSEPDFEVVAEAGDVDAARRYVRGHKPTVLVLDLNMPGGSVLEAIPSLRQEAPDTQIVVFAR